MLAARQQVRLAENYTKSPLGSGLEGDDQRRRSRECLYSSITCWYRIPVTAYTGWLGGKSARSWTRSGLRLRGRRSMCYIARAFLYESLRPSPPPPYRCGVRESDTPTTTLIVDLTSAIVSIGLRMLHSPFPSFSPFFFCLFRLEPIEFASLFAKVLSLLCVPLCVEWTPGEEN